MRLSVGNWVKKVDTQADRTGRTELGDFTVNTRLIFLALVSLFIGGVAAVVAVALLRTSVAALSSTMPLAGLRESFTRAPRGQHLFPVTDENGHLVGVLTHADIIHGRTNPQT